MRLFRNLIFWTIMCFVTAVILALWGFYELIPSPHTHHYHSLKNIRWEITGKMDVTHVINSADYGIDNYGFTSSSAQIEKLITDNCKKYHFAYIDFTYGIYVFNETVTLPPFCSVYMNFNYSTIVSRSHYVDNFGIQEYTQINNLFNHPWMSLYYFFYAPISSHEHHKFTRVLARVTLLDGEYKLSWNYVLKFNPHIPYHNFVSGKNPDYTRMLTTVALQSYFKYYQEI